LISFSFFEMGSFCKLATGDYIVAVLNLARPLLEHIRKEVRSRRPIPCTVASVGRPWKRTRVLVFVHVFWVRFAK
jgi:hypothetical protein